MTATRLLVLGILGFTAASALGQQGNPIAQKADPVASLTQELKAHTPPQWLVRVRWRESKLLASITPLPYDTAFQLWYEPEKLHSMLLGLCPRADEEIWKLLSADQDVVLEPTVGGKSGTEVQVSCRAALSG